MNHKKTTCAQLKFCGDLEREDNNIHIYKCQPRQRHKYSSTQPSSKTPVPTSSFTFIA